MKFWGRKFKVEKWMKKMCIRRKNCSCKIGVKNNFSKSKTSEKYGSGKVGVKNFELETQWKKGVSLKNIITRKLTWKVPKIVGFQRFLTTKRHHFHAMRELCEILTTDKLATDDSWDVYKTRKTGETWEKKGHTRDDVKIIYRHFAIQLFSRTIILSLVAWENPFVSWIITTSTIWWFEMPDTRNLSHEAA